MIFAFLVSFYAPIMLQQNNLVQFWKLGLGIAIPDLNFQS